MWRRPSPIASVLGGGHRIAVDERVGDPGLRELLLGVEQVAGVTNLRLIGHGREPAVEVAPRVGDQRIRRVELAAMDRPDRVGGCADRSACGGQRLFASSGLPVEPLVKVLRQTVEVHRAIRRPRPRRRRAR
jgi:hypothetical protein